ncbi:MAG: hypothetical protein COW30_03270 [Rhodospirillales bacterium CG15_BIG_FIL_POST_REV_8_21_14_020_66_15]|nr:MAG: hypothetical protein COW30_03270 [Rhodospirillales bacterium CG15_BIG_FIL_POST_REV_8_21_14_020_66_15]
MPWLVFTVAGALALSAALHHLGPAVMVLAGTGLPFALLALLSVANGMRRLRTGEIASGMALEVLGLGGILLLAVMGRWAWLNYF